MGTQALCSLIHVFLHCAIEYKPSVCWLCAVNWHITDCRLSASHRQILASLLLLRACDDVSTEAANQLGPLSEITPTQIRAQTHSYNTVFTCMSKVRAVHPMHVAMHRLMHRQTLSHECDSENTEAWSRETVDTLTCTKDTHTGKHAHTHTHILPTDKTQLWAQSSAPASTASCLRLTDRTWGLSCPTITYFHNHPSRG